MKYKLIFKPDRRTFVLLKEYDEKFLKTRFTDLGYWPIKPFVLISNKEINIYKNYRIVVKEHSLSQTRWLKDYILYKNRLFSNTLAIIKS